MNGEPSTPPARFPFNHYADVLDPFELAPEANGIADLGDDVADIYRDVVTGLRLYDRGRRAEALWTWRFDFRHHWGSHAVCALRALHCWLQAHASE